MSGKYSYYHQDTGEFHDLVVMTNLKRETDVQKFVIANTPADCLAIAGHYDRRRQRVDVATKKVIDKPSAPVAAVIASPSAK